MFKPVVQYTYATDTGPSLQSFTTAQRLAFNANSTDKNGNHLKSPVNDTLLACDPDTNFDCVPSLPSVLGVVAGQNPMPREFYAPIIRNGSSNNFDDGSGVFKTIADNAHFKCHSHWHAECPH
jgi:hypothetical protein